MRTLWIVVGLVACGDGGNATPDAQKVIDGAVVVVPDGPDPDALTTAERAAIGQLSPLPAPPTDLTNAFADNPAAARLGQMLFFDKGYAGALVVADDGTNGGLGQVGETGKVACVSCHSPGSATLDD
jgi:cytochrome c peroxidase